MALASCRGKGWACMTLPSNKDVVGRVRCERSPPMDETRQRATYVHVVVHEQVLPADYKALHGGVDMAAEHAWLGIRQPFPSGQTLGGAKSAIMCAHPQRTTNGGSPVGTVPIMWTGQDAGLIRSKSGTHMPIRTILSKVSMRIIRVETPEIKLWNMPLPMDCVNCR